MTDDTPAAAEPRDVPRDRSDAGVTGLVHAQPRAFSVTAAVRRGRRERSQAPGVEIKPPIKVGVLNSLSGTMAISSRPIVEATLLALEELNAAGGLLGRRIEPIQADGKSLGKVLLTFPMEVNNEHFATGPDALFVIDRAAKAIKKVVF